MYKFLTKNGQLIAFGIGVLLTVIFLGVAFAGLDEYHSLEAMDKGHESNAFNAGINAAVALTIVCFILMVLFGVFQVVTNLKNSLKGLVGFGVIVLIFIIGANTAGMETTGILGETIEKFGVTSTANAWISGGIITTAALGGIAVLAFLVSEVLNFFK